MEIPKNLKDEIWDYCRVNNIPNIDEFNLKLITQGFTIEKYGATPESRVVEKIVEKIVEVPVEKVVEKIITNDEETKKLAEENGKLIKENEELKNKIKKLQSTKDIYGE
jgi:cell division protein FtsB